jgi:hypothetical protein
MCFVGFTDFGGRRARGTPIALFSSTLFSKGMLKNYLWDFLIELALGGLAFDLRGICGRFLGFVGTSP